MRHDTNAHKDLDKFGPEHRLRVSRSVWWTPHSRLRRAMRVAKRVASLRAMLDLTDAVNALAPIVGEATVSLPGEDAARAAVEKRRRT